MYQYVMIMPWVMQDTNCGLSCHRMMLETTAEEGLSVPPNKVSQGDGGSDEGGRSTLWLWWLWWWLWWWWLWWRRRWW